MTSIWVLKVVTAYPCYKSPFAEVTNTFYSTADAAKVALKEKHFDYRYSDAYMDQVPFEASVTKVDCVDGKIEETKVWDYKTIVNEFADEFDHVNE